LKIAEINTGIIVTPTAQLSMWLGALKNDNAQGEYYLTDVVEPRSRPARDRHTQPDDDRETLA
jgi:bifunctional UDP-N-acetylglucosamine pyrophosphorylase/glucosamine-1-phosphate N-acetyltransferase